MDVTLPDPDRECQRPLQGACRVGVGRTAGADDHGEFVQVQHVGETVPAVAEHVCLEDRRQGPPPRTDRRHGLLAAERPHGEHRRVECLDEEVHRVHARSRRTEGEPTHGGEGGRIDQRRGPGERGRGRLAAETLAVKVYRQVKARGVDGPTAARHPRTISSVQHCPRLRRQQALGRGPGVGCQGTTGDRSEHRALVLARRAEQAAGRDGGGEQRLGAVDGASDALVECRAPTAVGEGRLELDAEPCCEAPSGLALRRGDGAHADAPGAARGRQRRTEHERARVGTHLEPAVTGFAHHLLDEVHHGVGGGTGEGARAGVHGDALGLVTAVVDVGAEPTTDRDVRAGCDPADADVGRVLARQDATDEAGQVGTAHGRARPVGRDAGAVGEREQPVAVRDVQAAPARRRSADDADAVTREPHDRAGPGQAAER